MLRLFQRKYRAMLMAWVMLLSFLPQVLVKGFHRHHSLSDGVACTMVTRTAAHSNGLHTAGKNMPTQHQHAAQHHSQSSQHQKKIPSDDGQSDNSNGHDCAICHYLISPFVPPTFTTFSFYALAARVNYLMQATPVRVVAVAAPTLRGPPQV